MTTLRPFQETAFADYRAAYALGTSHLGIAPTAFGKTIFAAELARRMVESTKHRFVMVAHRENLIAQNADKAQRWAPRLVVGKEQATESASGGCDFISASVGTLHEKRVADCAARWRADGRPIFLIVDEAHHALAPSYQQIIETLAPDRMLGLTATPFRTDDTEGKSLREVFPHLAFNIPRGPMIDDGWLSTPLHWSVRTGETLDLVASRTGDYVEAELARAVDVDPRNQLVWNAADEAAEELIALGAGVARAVCFAVSVEHAIRLAEGFKSRGWDAAAITGQTPIPERRAWDEKLRRPTRPTVLVSCGVLTEGWDVEEVNLGLFARPTKSPVLADQMLGRVLRHHASKPASVCIDFDDAGDGRVSIASTFQLPPRWDGQGESLRADEIWFAEQTTRASYSIRSLLWKATDRGDVGRLLAEQRAAGPILVPGRSFMWWDVGPEFRAVVGFGSVVIEQSPLGDYTVSYRLGETREEVGVHSTVSSALTWAEGWIRRKFPGKADYLLIRGGETEPATAAQKQAMKRLGLPVVPELTMREAREAIGVSMMETCVELERGRIGFGKYRGATVDRVPTWYLESFVGPGKNRDFLERAGRPELSLFEAELSRR